MEAGVRMTVGDFVGAARKYAELVDLAPRNAGYRLRLAVALSRLPLNAKQAERDFLEAVRLEPDNAEIHFQFGLFYKSMRQRARAVAELQAAVRLDPHHAKARVELEALSPRDTALQTLKKLFK